MSKEQANCWFLTCFAQWVGDAEKIKVVKAAEAAADAAHLQGQGIARQRAAIIDGLKESITRGTNDSLSSEKVLVTLRDESSYPDPLTRSIKTL
eukprot:6088350-Amphidinium_carterae.1